jgi:hypothetical protein
MTSLLIAREDRKLPWNDRLAMVLHLWACTACPKFEMQALITREGLKRWRNYSE